jgi:hypothetical protein
VPSLSTPAAIVIGFTIAGALSGLGLYLGARSSGSPPAAASSPLAPASAPPPASVLAGPAATTTTASAPIRLPEEAHARAVDEVTRTFEAQRARLVRECWTPSVARAAEPKQVAITFMLGYDEGGRPLTRGLREDLTRVRPDVTECVTRALPMAPIAPPGTPVRVTVTLTLP